MKIKKCQKCGKDGDISKMWINLLENPEPYMVDGLVFERIMEILCQECSELQKSIMCKSSFNVKMEGKV